MNMTIGENPAAKPINEAIEQARMLPDWAIRAGSIATMTLLPLTGAAVAHDNDSFRSQEQSVAISNEDSIRSSSAIEDIEYNRLSIWDAFEPRDSTLLLSGSIKMGLSTVDEQPMVDDNPDDFFVGDNPEGTPGLSEEESARANGEGYIGDSNGIYVKPVDIRPTGDYGASPDFNRLLTCSQPEAYDSPTIAKKLAAFCIKHGQRGMDVAFINFSNRSNKSVNKIMSGFEKSLKRVTGSLYRADPQKVAPTPEAKAAFDDLTIQDGGNRCLPTSSGFTAANKMRTVMANTLSKFSQVVVLTSLKPCPSSTVPENVFGVANFNGVDIIDIDEQSNKVASDTVLHEIGHNQGLDHYGVQVPKDAKFVKGKDPHFVIPDRFTSDRTLDISKYLGESELQPYDYTKKNVMGNAVSGKINFTKSQKHWMGWPNRLMGDNKTAKLIRTLVPEGISMKAKKTGNKPVVIKLAEPIKTGQIDHSEHIVHDGVSLTPVRTTQRINGQKRTAVGIDVEFTGSRDARSVTSGRWNLPEGISNIILSKTQIIEVTVAKNGTISMRENSVLAGKK